MLNEYLSKNRNEIGQVPRIVCNSGFSFSVQASEFHYCIPRSNKGPWVSVEVGYPSKVVDELLPYAEDANCPLDTVYSTVPIELVEQIIVKNRGMVS